jgi:Tfp pilus assembly protein PilF
MKGTLRLGTLVALALALACGHQSDLSKPAAQDNFGVQMARLNLWREAMFRFERAVQLNPGDAQAHNNLAVAYEAVGDFEKARKEYLEALKLDRNNSYIQKNYSHFVEFLSRNRKRQQANKADALPAKGATPGTGTSAVTNGRPPDRPVGADTPPPAIAPGGAPSDRPQPTPTNPPPTKPPGGVL